MRFVEVKINNYKSIGEENNILKIENGTTALIGKNESGKSNILHALKNIDFFNKADNMFYKQNNRITEHPITMEVILKFTEDEINKYKCKDELTILKFDSKKIIIEGELSNLIYRDTDLKNIIEVLYNDIINEHKDNILYINNETAKLNVNEKNEIALLNINKENKNIYEEKNKKYLFNKDHNKYLIEEQNKKNEIIEEKVLFIKKFMKNYHSQILSLYDKSNTKISNIIFEDIYKKLSNYYKLLPIIYLYEKCDIKNRYTYEEIKIIINEEKRDNITKFFYVAQVEIDDIINIFNEKNPGIKTALKHRINNAIDKNISDKFNSFYQQETIKIYIDFESEYFNIIFESNNCPMVLDELSDGIKWYFSLYIYINYYNMKNKNILLLLDEPGINLHIDAQKQLLKLLEDLSEKGSQIIYSTHSPFMLNGKNDFNIRLIQKNEFTSIYNKTHSAILATTSDIETISPLIQAIGFSYKFNLGPKANALNIITEGITDSIYIKAMIKYFDINEENINIIPSICVDNIHSIASILIGWGCDFKIIMDYDFEAEKAYTKTLKILNLNDQENVFCINGKSIDKVNMIKEPFVMEQMISSKDNAKLNNSDKYLRAKEFSEKIEKDEINLDMETIDNFNKLFDKIKII